MTYLPGEPEILDARQAFPDAQAALDGVTLERIAGLHSCGWYGSAISRERGAFALVDPAGALAELVGDRLRLTTLAGKKVVVYCFASEELDYDIHITRRAYQALSLLAVDRIDVIVEVLSG